MEKRICSKCKKVKDLSDFFVERKAKSGLRSECKECTAKYKKEWQVKYRKENKIRNDKWRAKNREILKEKGIVYRNKNKEEISEKGSEYYKENSSKIKKKTRDYYYSNKEIVAEKGKKYREKNKEKISKRRRKYRLEHKDEIKEGMKRWANSERGRMLRLLYNVERIALKKSVSDGTITLESVKKIWTGKCKSCNEKISMKAKRGQKYHCHLDHIIPLSKGGLHTINNVQWLCAWCNISKFNREKAYEKPKSGS